MKLTKSQLKEMIKEEMKSLNEAEDKSCSEAMDLLDAIENDIDKHVQGILARVKQYDKINGTNFMKDWKNIERKKYISKFYRELNLLINKGLCQP